MAGIEFGNNLEISLNQLLNVRVENGTGFTSGGAGSKGRLMFDTATSRVLYDDGANIQTIATLTDVAGLLDFKGGYNATTNTPNLTSGVGISKGDYYVVTVGGTFFGETLAIGDSLFANNDAPTTLAEWTLVQGNVVYASETVAGIVQFSTQSQANAGTDDTTAMTPLKVKEATYLPHKFTSASTTVGSDTPVTITHNLNNANPVYNIIRESTGETVYLLVNNFTANSFDITKTGANYNVIVTAIG